MYLYTMYICIYLCLYACVCTGSYKQEKADGEKGERVELLKDGHTDEAKAREGGVRERRGSGWSCSRTALSRGGDQ